MPTIERIHAREVFDSRGKPTVEVEVHCAGARPGRAIVPSGASTGRFEAVELRDGDADRLDGTGVRRAVRHVQDEIARELVGADAISQQEIDRRLCDLDGTADKSRLGANAILGVSLATAYAAAEALGILPVEHLANLWHEHRSAATVRPLQATPVPETEFLLPLPMINMISGGLHAGRNLDFQDFLILPIGATSFHQAMDWTVTIYRRLGAILRERGLEGTLVGDEGGYGPRLSSNSDAVECLMAAIEAAELRSGTDVAIGLDVASTHFSSDNGYLLAATHGECLSAGQMIDLFESWIEQYPIISIEDGLDEEDWAGWTQLTARLGERVQLIGDDLFVTNRHRLERGIGTKAGNSVLIKVNQIGTLTETLQTMSLALDHGYRPVVSARSGETEDIMIADLAVATSAGQIKIGSVARSERLAKYNQLLRLEEVLGTRARYAGSTPFASP